MIRMSIEGIINFLLQFSYLGVFLINFLGAVSIIFPIPYQLVILTLGMQGFNPVLLAIAGGLGSGLGEYSGYLIGYYGRAIFSEERQRKMKYIMKLFDRYGPITVFLFALTPLPDDLLFIPLGILRYGFLRLFVPCFLGKTFLSFALAIGGQTYYELLRQIFGEESWLGSILTSIMLLLLLIAMWRVDWEKRLDRFIKKSN